MSKISKYPIFNDCIDSLYNTSIDKITNEHMCQNKTFNVVNFDNVVKNYIFSKTNISTSNFRSNDALIILNNDSNYIFVEFKNGNLDATPNRELKKEQIRTKINESLWIFNDITGADPIKTRASVQYILVYNSKKNDNNKFAKNLANKAKKKFVIGGLNHFLCFFKDIKTVTEQEFEQIINSIESGSYVF